MSKVKIQWRKSRYTDDLDDKQKSKFYTARHHVVRAIQTHDKQRIEDNKMLKYAKVSALKIELSDDEIDVMARNAFDNELMPRVNGNNIELVAKNSPIELDRLY
tara:strand:- start:1360 stop:1671 length:312 start_codon:yes stop_codon:yes gene_type:complete